MEALAGDGKDLPNSVFLSNCEGLILFVMDKLAVLKNEFDACDGLRGAGLPVFDLRTQVDVYWSWMTSFQVCIESEVVKSRGGGEVMT